MRENKGKVYFIFGVHNHQPAGNLSFIFDEAFHRCYLPFITLLEEFPSIKCAVHNSGPIYDYRSEDSARFFSALKRLIGHGQVELVGGGYYEPILTLIPDEDKIGQINFMNDFLRNKFNFEPKGLWLAERVWEQSLVEAVSACGLKYTILDEVHLRGAGIKDAIGYYTAESAGKSISVFPINQELMYKIPFCTPAEVIDILLSFKKDTDTLVTLFLDGEKFGLRPDTFERVYKQEWLKEFFSLLNSCSGIETITPSRALEKFPSHGAVNIPPGSYEKMREWTNGEDFKSFLSKYRQLNYMHKRMFSLSERINKFCGLEKDKDIFISLWKAQTNCPYWHGLFGGFYLPHLRQSIYKNLIEAENLLDERRRRKKVAVEKKSVDSGEEVVLKNKGIICCFSSKGGALREMSLRGKAFNVLNTISRVKEGYHSRIKRTFTYDSYERLGLIDHILEEEMTPEDFSMGEGVRSLSGEYYKPAVQRAWRGINLSYRFKEQGMDFKKQVRFKKGCEFEAYYKFNKTNALNNHNFGIEFNLALSAEKSFLNGPKDWGRRRIFEVSGRFEKATVRFEFDEARVFTFPLYTVSSSEIGFEKLYQQLTVLFILEGTGRPFRMKVKGDR